jgi:transposase InsO family protein
MAQVAAVYEQFQTQVSLRGFMRIAGLPYWLLRDYRRGASRRQQRQKWEQQLQQAVRQTALEHPTYGYRRLSHVLKARGWRMGRERVRRLLAALDLEHERPKKRRRAAPGPPTAAELPEGRRVQIDATRLSLSDGVAWVYMVEDVASRVCLAASAGRSLSKERAAQALQDAHYFLRQGGITASLVIQSDGGSELTSEYFQRCCQGMGQWVRCRINQAGGMGIVERLHRTFKYEFVFRHEVTTSVELKALVPQFQTWYNVERLHSSLGYQVPWQRLLTDGAALT